MTDHCNVPHRFELTLVVPGTPEQVWEAIATADGIASWMMSTELDAREGGALAFHMGPGVTSNGRVTAFEPARRFAYEEDWDEFSGHPDADVTPLATEFLVEARSGGTCVVTVVTSAFGTGADWENEFFDEMTHGWGAILDNLRLYLTHFPGQHASAIWAGVDDFPATPEETIAALQAKLGAEAVGDKVDERGVLGEVERVVPRHFLVRMESPVPGLLNFYSFNSGETTSGVHVQGYVFSDAASDYAKAEQPAWQAWLEGVAREHAAPEAAQA
ncbi:MAG TPA: SRPBCC domain-containing protein [Acidimicrobiales bacterium]|nr:SRPBCC domain-containing protein [Acidimicrobiales bacterium]